MKEIIITYLPWFLSANTLYFTFLAGNKKKGAWALALVGQLFWLVWILATQSWGLLPMNIGMWVMYSRNYIKWSN
jgi:hypothetical protein